MIQSASIVENLTSLTFLIEIYRLLVLSKWSYKAKNDFEKLGIISLTDLQIEDICINMVSSAFL